MDFTIVKIMNELGVSEEEARALVEFDLKHKKVEGTEKIEKNVVKCAGAEQLTKNTKNTKITKNTKNTQNSKNTKNTKNNTQNNTKNTISNTEKVDNPIENTNHSTNESIEPKLSDINTNPTPKISETRNVEIFKFENENSKSKFKKQSFISEIENQILENYIGIEFPQNLNSTSVSFKVDGKYYTLKLTEHKSRPSNFKE